MTLTLDLIATQPTLALSVRLLRAGYAGSCLRVRRSSDNTEQDIGFVANYLDTASLLTFCGAGDGFVTKWYDQSANAWQGRQATTANQPKIVSSGALVTESGNTKVAVQFADTTDKLPITTSTGTAVQLGSVITNSASTHFGVVRVTSNNTSSTSYSGTNVYGDGSGGSSYSGLKLYGTNKAALYNWDGSEDDANFVISTGVRYVFENRHDTGTLYNKATGIGEVSVASGNTQVTTGQYALGDGSTSPANYLIQEVIVYNTALSSGDRGTLNSDITTYFADAVVTASKVFRKTFSGIGTRVGTRQVQGW